MYYGRGAGGMPTASAVVADLSAVAMGTAQRAFAQLGIWPDLSGQANQLAIDEVRSRYYIRVMAEDRPGVLAQVATILGRHGISISSVLQHEAINGAASTTGVPVVITTHRSQEGNVRTALGDVDAMEAIKAASVCIGIVDEHPEQL